MSCIKSKWDFSQRLKAVLSVCVYKQGKWDENARESSWEAGLWTFLSATLSLFNMSLARTKLTRIYLFFTLTDWRLKSKHKVPLTMNAMWVLSMNARTSLFTNQHSTNRHDTLFYVQSCRFHCCVNSVPYFLSRSPRRTSISMWG